MLTNVKKIPFSFFFTSEFFCSYSQSLISGKITDNSDIGIPYADILLLDEQGNWTNDRTSSDENGDFKLKPLIQEDLKFRLLVLVLKSMNQIFFQSH